MAEVKTKTNKIEREYVIPLREKVRVVPRYKKTNKAVKTVKEFLVKHMRIYDRDLKKIKIDRFLNEYLWFRGIRSPPHKVKVKAIKEGDIVKVELAEMPDKLKFKKAREEKREKKATEILEESKSALEKAKEAMTKPKEKPGEKTGTEVVSDGEEEKEKASKEKEEKEEKEKKEKDEQEKKSAVVEAGQKRQKQQAKKQKHMTQPKSQKQMHREQKIMSTK